MAAQNTLRALTIKLHDQFGDLCFSQVYQISLNKNTNIISYSSQFLSHETHKKEKQHTFSFKITLFDGKSPVIEQDFKFLVPLNSLLKLWVVTIADGSEQRLLAQIDPPHQKSIKITVTPRAPKATPPPKKELPAPSLPAPPTPGYQQFPAVPWEIMQHYMALAQQHQSGFMSQQMPYYHGHPYAYPSEAMHQQPALIPPSSFVQNHPVEPSSHAMETAVFPPQFTSSGMASEEECPSFERVCESPPPSVSFAVVKEKKPASAPVEDKKSSSWNKVVAKNTSVPAQPVPFGQKPVAHPSLRKVAPKDAPAQKTTPAQKAPPKPVKEEIHRPQACSSPNDLPHDYDPWHADYPDLTHMNPFCFLIPDCFKTTVEINGVHLNLSAFPFLVKMGMIRQFLPAEEQSKTVAAWKRRNNAREEAYKNNQRFTGPKFPDYPINALWFVPLYLLTQPSFREIPVTCNIFNCYFSDKTRCNAGNECKYGHFCMLCGSEMHGAFWRSEDGTYLCHNLLSIREELDKLDSLNRSLRLRDENKITVVDIKLALDDIDAHLYAAQQALAEEFKTVVGTPVIRGSPENNSPPVSSSSQDKSPERSSDSPDVLSSSEFPALPSSPKKACESAEKSPDMDSDGFIKVRSKKGQKPKAQ